MAGRSPKEQREYIKWLEAEEKRIKEDKERQRQASEDHIKKLREQNREKDR